MLDEGNTQTHFQPLVDAAAETEVRKIGLAIENDRLGFGIVYMQKRVLVAQLENVRSRCGQRRTDQNKWQSYNGSSKIQVGPPLLFYPDDKCREIPEST